MSPTRELMAEATAAVKFGSASKDVVIASAAKLGTAAGCIDACCGVRSADVRRPEDVEWLNGSHGGCWYGNVFGFCVRSNVTEGNGEDADIAAMADVA